MMPHAFITISQLQDKKPYIETYFDEDGHLLLNKAQVDYCDKKEVFINVNCLGYTAIENIIMLEKGSDYIIRSRIPATLSGNIAKDNKWEICQLNENEILIRKDSVIKLKKIVTNCLYFDFPFDKDITRLYFCMTKTF